MAAQRRGGGYRRSGPRAEHAANPAAPTADIQARPTAPRSMRVHDAALLAARELLTEGGLAAAPVDAIAALPEVSKATIYKHLPSRTAVAAEPLGGSPMDDAPPLPD